MLENEIHLSFPEFILRRIYQLSGFSSLLAIVHLVRLLVYARLNTSESSRE